MSKRKVITWAVILLFVAIQFIRPKRNDDGKVAGAAFIQLYVPPDSINRILRDACYDCHSNNTRYPWYTNIQPIGWILAGHIKRGKSKLNFSEFNNYSNRRQASKLKGIEGSIKDGTMPLWTYTLIHKNAKLSKEERTLVIDWLIKTRDSLTSKE
jgi:hypothetical protein